MQVASNRPIWKWTCYGLYDDDDDDFSDMICLTRCEVGVDPERRGVQTDGPGGATRGGHQRVQRRARRQARVLAQRAHHLRVGGVFRNVLYNSGY